MFESHLGGLIYLLINIISQVRSVLERILIFGDTENTIKEYIQ